MFGDKLVFDDKRIYPKEVLRQRQFAWLENNMTHPVLIL
jgi:hypothetical protein